jgi:acyl-CoA synthetase (NDP forming)
MSHPARRTFDALFDPRAIALVGASADPAKHTARPQKSLDRHGYEGTVIPVNPRRDSIFGATAYPTLADVPMPVDHAFIMVPLAGVYAVVEDCIKMEVPVATIYTDGFADAGEAGLREQQRIVDLAREGCVRLLGPNCSGIYSNYSRCALSTNSVIEQLEITPGPLAIISQSGSMTGGLISRGVGRGVGFSRVVSIGNECDITVGEITDWLVDDDETGAILLFLETVRDARRLAQAARRAIDAGKPVIAYKLGRSDVGRALAASHTGAMAGAAEVADAFFMAHGILRVDNLETLFELPALVSGRRPATSHRVAVMSTTGGGAATVADELGGSGVCVVAPDEELIDILAAQGIQIPQGLLTDLTMAGTKAEVYSAVLNGMLDSTHCDLVLAVAGSSAQFQPEATIGPILAASQTDKPLAVFVAPSAPDALRLLQDNRVAAFRTPESCADAIRAWSKWRPPAAEGPVDGTRAGEVVAAVASLGDRRPNEVEAAEFFEALGIRSAASSVIQDGNTAVDLRFPVVCKVLSRDIAHKTDAGGVELGIEDAAALARAVARIIASVGKTQPAAVIDGLLVQEMESGLAEVILGFRHDAEVGPIVLLGAGGVLAELYHDVAIRLAPVTLEVAHEMIEGVRGLATIRGYRGMQRGDVAALAAAIVAMSELALAGEAVFEAEINPLLVRAEGAGVIAVDGLVLPSASRRPDLVEEHG